MISTTEEYALRAADYLVQHAGKPQTSALIAEGTRVPHGYLSKILQQMARAELVSSQRGLHGGFLRGRKAEEIPVLDVLRSVDAAPQRLRKCPLGITGHTSLCPVHKLVDEATARTEQAFASANLKQLARSARTGIKALCEPIS